MGDYFKPWQRKMGCVTLLLTSVFIAGWVRSSFYLDRFGFRFRNQLPGAITCAFQSVHGHLGMQNIVGGGSVFTCPPGWSSTPITAIPSRFKGRIRAAWEVPYWKIVISLTLLSIFLLFSKPHPQPSPELEEIGSIDLRAKTISLKQIKLHLSNIHRIWLYIENRH